MRVCILCFGEENSRLKMISEGLSRGIERQGHQVDIFSVRDISYKKLTIYEYICVGMEKKGFFSSAVPSSIPKSLKAAGLIAGKRSYAFVLKHGFRTSKALSNLMKCMEEEGMFLKKSDVLRNPMEAEAVGKKLHISVS